MSQSRYLGGYLKELYLSFKVFSSVSKEFFILACVALAFSRICQVMAFFLPIKFFIVISSGEVPEYIDFFPEYINFSDLVSFIFIFVPLLYLLFIAMGIAYRWMIDRHWEIFKEKELKLDKKRFKDKKIKTLHNHLSKALSDVGIMLASVFFALLLSPMMALFWIFLLYLNLWLFHRKALHIEDHQRLTFLRLHPRQFIDYVSSSNFLVVFGLLALALLYLGMGVYTAIFLLLVSRMMFQALNRFAVGSINIVKCLH